MSKDKEEWRPIQDYEGIYEVSSLGRVRSLDRYVQGRNGSKCNRRGRQLRLTSYHNGYVIVTLCKPNSKKKRGIVHRLVAEAFIPNPENKPVVNHKNGIKHDNRLENLEWCTHSENNIHALVTGLKIPAKGSKSGGSVLNEEQVLKICDLLDNTDMTIRQISTLYEVNESAISNIHRGAKWNWITGRKDNVELYKSLQKEKHHMAKKVVNCRGEEFTTAKEASSKYNISRGNLSEACNGKRNYCGKYKDGTPIRWSFTQ